MTFDLPSAAFDEALSQFPYPTVYVTVSSSHLYGFPSQDSDFDLRGSHLLPGSAYWGLSEPRETLEPHFDTKMGQELNRLLLTARENGVDGI